MHTSVTHSDERNIAEDILSVFYMPRFDLKCLEHIVEKKGNAVFLPAVSPFQNAVKGFLVVYTRVRD